MFTVKHIDTTGVHRIYSASTLEVVNNGNALEDGIYLDWPTFESMPPKYCEGQLEPSERPNPAHVIRFAQCRSIDDVDPVVYVMNEKGATVGTYKL